MLVLWKVINRMTMDDTNFGREKSTSSYHPRLIWVPLRFRFQIPSGKSPKFHPKKASFNIFPTK